MPNVLVGLDLAADAGIYQLREDLALVQTVDFFTPIVDDPYDFGRIAATNALSDVYVMGGTPLTALNIACFPKNGNLDWLAAILNGGLEQAAAAGVAIIGGHTVDDPEIKYGLAVTGTVHPQRIIHSHTARPGDVLVLTKPLGTGILSTALKSGQLDATGSRRLTEVMVQLNRQASAAMIAVGAHAATDVTGFGLLGHAHEMAQASQVTFHLSASMIPLLPGALQFARAGYLTGGGRSNAEFVGTRARLAAGLEAALVSVWFDPQTAGGLLIALPPQRLREFLDRLAQEEARPIGEVGVASEFTLIVD
ncbi:MAG: Selenide, water dikinase [bacterium]|nr:Selenide, water dikinase [bacterium]